MRKPALGMIILFSFALGCASGTSGGTGDDDDDTAPPFDSPESPFPDAGPPRDALWDAPRPRDSAAASDGGIIPGLDGGIGFPDGGMGMCTDTSMCGAGQCCLTLGGPSGFCIDGTEIPMLGCVPTM